MAMLKNRVNGGVPEPECGIVTYPKKERKQRRPRSYHSYYLVHIMCNLVSCFACSGHSLKIGVFSNRITFDEF